MNCRCNYSSAASIAFVGWLLILSTTTVSAGLRTDHECVKGREVPSGADFSEWPELFRLNSTNPEDPTKPNKDESATVDPSVLYAAGVTYRKLDPTGYDYPKWAAEIPWSPPVNGNNDMDLQAIRDEHDYHYADIIVVTAYKAKFYEEHLHAGGDEVRYVIDGSGYFDIRDVNDEWVRMHAKAGDFVEFPAGIQHRFAVDESLMIQAMRLFPGSDDPDWSSVPRSEVKGNNKSRNDYVTEFLCGEDPDFDHPDHHSPTAAPTTSMQPTSSSAVVSSSLTIFVTAIVALVLS